MLEKEFYISQLISSKIKNELSPEQEIAWNVWLAENVKHQEFVAEFYEESKFNKDLNRYVSKDKTVIWAKIATELNDKKDKSVQSSEYIERIKMSMTIKPKLSPIWIKIAVAASIVCVLGMGGYFLSQYFNPYRGVEFAAGADLKPGSNKATITLDNGKTIVLSGNKTAVLVDASKMVYNDGTNIVSDADAQVVPDQKIRELKLATPSGGQYEAVLPDGTRVWLNAASTLKFPSSFSGKDRIVTLSGEAYFNVSKDKTHPFKVRTARQEVEVLGTHFNVNSYADEPTVNTTLFEGSVKINDDILLVPGEQANLYKTGKVVVSKAGADAAAWKDGKFAFEDTDLQTVLRQLARWYDVEIVYPNGIPQESFTGYIDRNLKASDALNILTYTKVNFKIEGKKILVFK